MEKRFPRGLITVKRSGAGGGRQAARELLACIIVPLKEGESTDNAVIHGPVRAKYFGNTKGKRSVSTNGYVSSQLKICTLRYAVERRGFRKEKKAAQASALCKRRRNAQ